MPPPARKTPSTAPRTRNKSLRASNIPSSARAASALPTHGSEKQNPPANVPVKAPAAFSSHFPSHSTTCAVLYNSLLLYVFIQRPPSLLQQQLHPLHRLFHLPEITSLQIPRHRRHIQPHRLRGIVQSALLPEDRDRFPLLLRHFQQQRILQSINQIGRGIEPCILRLKSRQNPEFISFACLQSLQRHACELKCLASQPIHRLAHYPRHFANTDPHPQP